MNDNNTVNGRREESPKEIFRLLPRPAVKPTYKGEDPKAFLRRMGQRVQRQNLNPGEAARA
jgi:hypothetical protein